MLYRGHHADAQAQQGQRPDDGGLHVHVVVILHVDDAVIFEQTRVAEMEQDVRQVQQAVVDVAGAVARVTGDDDRHARQTALQLLRYARPLPLQPFRELQADDFPCPAP